MEIDWPENDGLYKVVQVVIKGQKQIEISKTGKGFHADILSDLLKKANVSFELNENYLRPVPLSRGKEYQLFGAGKVRIEAAGKTAKFGGTSIDYQMELDEDHLKTIKTDWKIEYVGMFLK